MSNLTVENLGRIIGDGSFEGRGHVDELFTAKGIRTTGPSGTEGSGVSGASFSKILEESLEKVNQYQVEADVAIKNLVAGRDKNIHETMLTLERADTSLKLMMQVRNKILEAYKEVMRMQV